MVLIGPDAATNPWIRYAIEISYTKKNPMIALYINELPDERGDSAEADLNPLERFAVMELGKKVYLSDRYATNTWSDLADGEFDRWLDEAKNAMAPRKPRMSTKKFVDTVAAMAATGGHSNTNHDFDIANL